MRSFLAAMTMILMPLISNASDPIDINVNANQTSFLVSLPANPTTGYSWTLKNYNTSLLKLVSSQYHPVKTNLIGAGGETTFTFEVIQGTSIPKSTQIELLYAQPWEPKNGTLQKVNVYFISDLNTEEHHAAP